MVIIGILLPFICTSLGAIFVYFIKDNISKKFNVLLLAFSSGIMLSSAIFSLLIPALDFDKSSILIIMCFALGIIILYLFDIFLNKSMNKDMVLLAISLHNIPEGLAVGVAFAGFIYNFGITLASAMAISIGIAIQNIPEGAVVSLPLHLKGVSKNKAFFKGCITGFIEPICSIIAIIITSFISSLLPFVLAFAAGAMFYVTIDKLIFEYKSDDSKNISIIFFTIGFSLMMLLEQYL